MGSLTYGGRREANEALAEAYFPHRLKTLTPIEGSFTQSSIQSVNFGPCRILSAQIGAAEVSIATEHSGGYGINIPLNGDLYSIIDGTEVTAAVGQALVCPPDVPTVFPHWGPAGHMFCLRIDTDYMRSEMGQVLGRSDQSLPMCLELRGADGSSWLELLRSVHAQSASSGGGLMRNEAMRARLASLVSTGFILAAVPDSAFQQKSCPRVVRRVITAIEDDPARDWSTAEFAEVSGVGARRLQQAFREYVGTTPFAYLRQIRLERAHADLQRAEPPTTVLDIAVRWGIKHAGRFADEYRRKYGIAPSESLRRNG